MAAIATLLSARLARFLDIFPKPQRRHFLAYLMGLMLIIKFRSVRRISREFSRLDQSALNHFLTDAPWDERDLVVCSQALVRKRLGNSIQLVIDDTADERSDKHLEGVSVLALWDAWFTCAAVAQETRGRGWHYLGAVKSNRIVFVGGKRHSARDLAKERREYSRVKGGKHSFRAARMIGRLNGLGEVARFIVKGQGIGTRFLVSSDLALSAADAVRTYARRFWLETQFREAKQHFGFGERFVRKWRGVQKHWALVMTAYNAAQLLKHSLKRPQSRTTGAVLRARQKEFRTKDVKLFISEILSEAA